MFRGKLINDDKISLINLRNRAIIRLKYNSGDYGVLKLNDFFNNFSSKYVAIFRDLLIYNDQTEFLKK